jgi:2'-5' RNA ligase
MKRIYNFGLLFEHDHNDAFINYSEDLNRALPSDFRLGDKSLPHLTVLQFEAERDTLRSLWDNIRLIGDSPLPLSLAGLTFLPSKEGPLWVEIAVLKSTRLQELQDIVVSRVGGAKIHSGTNDSFRPHITLARALNTRLIERIRIDENVVRRKNVVGQISLGLSGENYQYNEVLFS